MRKLLVKLHLVFAAFLAPLFIVVGITGGNYLLDNKGEFSKSSIELAADSTLDFESSTIEDDIKKLLVDNNISHKYEYARVRTNSIQLRPTSKKYIEFRKTATGVEAYWVKPNLQGSFMELHKGHGPTLFKTYQKIAAFSLVGIVLGGFLVGILSPIYRRMTLATAAIGTVGFIALAFLA